MWIKWAYQMMISGFEMRFSASIDIKIIFWVVTMSKLYCQEWVLNQMDIWILQLFVNHFGITNRIWMNLDNLKHPTSNDKMGM